MKRWSGLMSMFVVLALAFVMACGGDDEEAVPAAAPAIDTAELAKVVQEAVQQAVPQQVTAAEIQRMVETAVTAAAPGSRSQAWCYQRGDREPGHKGGLRVCRRNTTRRYCH